MEFYNQNWFWAGLFPVIASLGGILIKELISTRAQAKLERLKLYESDVFKAYNSLYQFISSAYSFLWPPNDPREEYIEFMKRSYFKDVKSSMLFFNPEIRDILGILESQYYCLRDSDLIPEKPFNEFYNNDLSKLLGRLEKAVEKRIDLILPKGT
jgi:hypothetical protein